MIQIFNNVRQSTIDFNFETITIVAVVDANKSIIDSTENIDCFDSKYSNSSNKNSFIMNFDRYIYYRDVYVFIDRLKNLKQSFFDFRIKKYVFACMKNDALAWLSTEFNILKKNLLRKIDVENWCKALIRRFKKRDVVVLKKLQSSFYIFIDVRSDKTSRVYVQNILRYSRTIEYDSIYHQLLNAWNDLELKFRMQISKSIFNIEFSIFFELLNFKIIIWIEMTVKRFNVEISNFDNNNVDKNWSMNKQNRERQNDFSQQFDVNDFFFLLFNFSDHFKVIFHINFRIQFIKIKDFSISSSTKKNNNSNNYFRLLFCLRFYLQDNLCK